MSQTTTAHGHGGGEGGEIARLDTTSNPTAGAPGSAGAGSDIASTGSGRLGDGAVARLEADAKLVIDRYPRPRSALLPLLHLVQAEQGYVTPDGIEFCARMLGLTTAEVTAVATFYTMYKRAPVGDYAVGVCTNTLCAVLGGDEIYARLQERLGHGEHGANGGHGAHGAPGAPGSSVSLEHLECNAACDYAPVVMVNWEFFDNMTPQSALDLVDRLEAGDLPHPTRGAPLRTFREISRVLAGFYDGRADEGVSAGPATLAGLRLARQAEAGEGAAAADGADTSRGSGRDASDEEMAATSPMGYGPPATDGGPGRSGQGAGPSASDAGLQTAAADPANPSPAVAPDAGQPEAAGGAAGPAYDQDQEKQ